MVTALLASACGFHLRGSYGVPEALMPLHIDAPADSGVGRALRDALRRQGAAIAQGPEAAVASLVVLDEREDRRVLSVDSSAKVNEYEIRKSVRWQLVKPGAAANGGEDDSSESSESSESGARTLIAPSQLQARRDYEFDSAQVLSKAEEERKLYADMAQALAQQILARLQAWSPESE